MTPFVTALLIVAGVLLLLAALWVFLVCPAPKKKRMTALSRPYAHRGLWGGEVPENSLAAFRRAAEQGFAIELDVQLSADGQVFVFHDYSLKRMCGREELLSALPSDILLATRLCGSEWCIPTLEQVLDTVAGRVPLLIELKGESGDTSLCPAVWEILQHYRGEYCVESFNPLLLRWFRRHAPRVVRGLLVTNLLKEKKSGSKVVNFLLGAECLNFLCRPAFIAWDIKHQNSLARLFATRVCGACSFVYTIKNETDYRALLATGHFPIFDSFTPAKGDHFR